MVSWKEPWMMYISIRMPHTQIEWPSVWTLLEKTTLPCVTHMIKSFAVLDSPSMTQSFMSMSNIFFILPVVSGFHDFEILLIFSRKNKPKRLSGPLSKYPYIQPNHELVGLPSAFVLGTASHMLDFRKSSGGFIHGYRYTGNSNLLLLERSEQQL